MTAHKKHPASASEATPSAAPTPAVTAAPAPFAVVGIGASAGGLAAFEAFFKAMPIDKEPGMAFVVV